jgi:glycosyltransferase involved in cell wall biosynthesis
MVVPVPAYPVRPGVCAIESAFAAHLRLLRSLLGPVAVELVVAGPELSAEDYQKQRHQLAELDAAVDGIRFRSMFPLATGRLGYWRRFGGILKALSEEVERADIVHAGCSSIYRPFEFAALLLGKRHDKITISVSDIDNRATPRMQRAIGAWGWREYVWTKAVHSTWSHLQQQYAVRNFSLVLLKGLSYANDYGAQRSNVRFFLDSAFGGEHVIGAEKLAHKLEYLRANRGPVRVVYFGRLVAYKGVDRMLQAVRVALDCGAQISFRIIGDGPCREQLVQLRDELGLGSAVEFVGAVPYGPGLFDMLYASDLLLAAPLSEDTPRSALDAAAAAIPLVAFDTSYYKDLQALGAAVHVSPWPDAEALGRNLAAVATNREALARDVERALLFARDNTQEIWLNRRIEWTKTAAAQHPEG